MSTKCTIFYHEEAMLQVWQDCNEVDMLFSDLDTYKVPLKKIISDNEEHRSDLDMPSMFTELLANHSINDLTALLVSPNSLIRDIVRCELKHRSQKSV